MASKYSGLKGRIPIQETPRGEAVAAEIKRHGDKDIKQLTEDYNAVKSHIEQLEAKVAEHKAVEQALLVLIRRRIDASGADSITINGRTWSETFDPFPVCDDIGAIVTYLKENGMEDQLELTKSELSSRLKDFVKNEALANELDVEEVKKEDGSVETVVKSKIPGVRVYLKPGLSKAKAGKAKP